MDILIRELVRSAEGTVSYRDTEINTGVITIGSGGDQVIQLAGPSVAAAHATVALSADQLQLDCRRGCELLVNETPVRRARLSEGDVLSLDGHRLELIAAPGGFDVALQLERNIDAQRAGFEGAFSTELRQTWLSKRIASWSLFGLVLLLGLVGPLLWHFNALPTSLTGWIPDDQIWSSGPLLPAHELVVAGDCGACHRRLLERAPDGLCLECHTVQDHTREAVLHTAGLEPERCASCHREHNEPQRIVASEDSGCVACHAEPDRFGREPELSPVSRFTAQGHPAFNATLQVPQANPRGTGLGFDWQAHQQPVAIAQENSHLKFSHEAHLDPDQVLRVDNGQGLGCADCHVLSTDRERFVPITMQRHCQSCHDLTFDPADPGRQLPHGEPVEVVMTIEGHFMRKHLAPSDAAAAFRRRLPERPQRDDDCSGDAFRCAVEATRRETENQFSQRGCITCHTVVDHADAEIHTRFQVYPVRLGYDYFRSLRFDHAQHRIQGDAGGDEACLNCHAATASTFSTALLLPDLDTCLSCHDTSRGRSGVLLGCSDCHAYHPERTL